MTAFSAQTRKNVISDLKSETYDLIIVGGGITGAGILLDATARGLKCCLIEKGDFASGTSSRSTKLIHGGLRYLKQLDFKLVAEVGKERKIVSVIANHLTYPERVLLPFTKTGSLKKWSTRFALMLYEFLSKVEKVDGFKMLDKSAVKKLIPNLNENDLLGGADYVEYRTNDARLTLEVIKTAYEKEACPLSYCEVERFSKDNDIINGVYVNDLLNDDSFLIKGSCVVNATGPWVDSLRSINDKDVEKKLLHTKGVHLVFDKIYFPLDQAVYFDTPDKRMVFAIPRGEKVYVGTTDTLYDKQLEHPDINEKDRVYIVTAINFLFPDLDLKVDHIESGWSGVRPLINQKGKSPSEVSRKDEIFEDSSGLISIAGGKLTGYRKMSEKIVDLVSKRLRKKTECNTDTLLLSGAIPGGLSGFQVFINKKTPLLVSLGLKHEIAIKLIRRFGKNIDRVIELFNENEFNASQMPLEIYLSLKYALEYEMTLSLTDFFIRRTNALYFNIKLVKESRQHVAEFMKVYLDWNDKIMSKQLLELDSAIKQVAHTL